IEYQQTGKKVDWVRLTNVKSYVAAMELTVRCETLGELVFDVAYGGNFYAIIEPQKNFSGIENYSAGTVVRIRQQLRQQINEKYPGMFVHPVEATINSVSHIQWTGKPINPKSTSRNAVFYGDKAIDRSPCGTGTSARMAQWHAKGLLKQGDEFVHESFIGSQFIGRVEQVTELAGSTAIV